jgi:UDP-N-acetylglucosamine--N-acetylmuramyl-(pentapeptide) pyrophosphoryl-undecaprenol N-acetylglucosamine transferase
MTQKTYVLTAGGTGGHGFPAQALARYLSEQDYRIILMTDARFASYKHGLDKVEIITVPSGRMGAGLLGKAKGVLGILRGILSAWRRLRTIKPNAVIGFGGYPSFPTMKAAQILGIPTLIHEQNRLMGKANRLVVDKAHIIATSFPDILGISEANKAKTKLTGNPVRAEISALRKKTYQAPKTNEPIHLLIFGGSQGAQIFSEVLPEAIAQLPESIKTRLSITQQCRAEDLPIAQAVYTKHGITADLKPFFEDMDIQLAKAHLVICRSGASTLAEMMMAGKPGLYVPYQYAAEDHQTINAQFMLENAAGWLVPQQECTIQRMYQELTALIEHPEQLENAAAKAKILAKTDATASLSKLLKQF